jgi:hypothetical protein
VPLFLNAVRHVKEEMNASRQKRFLAGAFDYILVILIGSIADRAMTGGGPYFPSLLALLSMVALHLLFSLLDRAFRFRSVTTMMACEAMRMIFFSLMKGLDCAISAYFGGSSL